MHLSYTSQGLFCILDNRREQCHDPSNVEVKDWPQYMSWSIFNITCPIGELLSWSSTSKSRPLIWIFEYFAFTTLHNSLETFSFFSGTRYRAQCFIHIVRLCWFAHGHVSTCMIYISSALSRNCRAELKLWAAWLFTPVVIVRRYK